MLKKNYFVFLFLCVLLVGCVSTVSTERPFTNVYEGETEKLLEGTRWELVDLKSSDNFTLIVEFIAGGTMSWYTIPDNYNTPLSENSTWERIGNTVIFNARNGFYLYEGIIRIIDEKGTVTGRYKTGYDRRVLKSHPQGDFSMIEL